MARIRSFRPDLWDEDDFTALTDGAKLCLFRLMSHVSDQGRIKCKEAFLLGRLYPNGGCSGDLLASRLTELCNHGFATVYTSKTGKPLLELVWSDPTSPIRQVISRPSPCKLPGSDEEGSAPLTEWLTESLMERLTQARMSDSSKGAGVTPWGLDGTGQDRTGPDGTVRDGPGQDRLPVQNGLRSVSGSGLAGGQASTSAAPVGSGKSEGMHAPLNDEAMACVQGIVDARAAGNEEREGYFTTRLRAKRLPVEQIRAAIAATPPSVAGEPA